jgi:hypothetical protein
MTASSTKTIPTYVCSLTLPTTTSLYPYSITKLDICSNDVCPPLTCNCYTVSNGGPINGQGSEFSSVYMSYIDCDNLGQVMVINDYTTTLPFCSLTTPFINSSTNIITVTLLDNCASCSS